MTDLLEQSTNQDAQPYVRSLRELIDLVSGRSFKGESGSGDAGIAEKIPFPFLALVGQLEMKLALLMALVNPAIGGVLLIGPRGTGKTTAVRSLIDLLPDVDRSKCFYGCTAEDIISGGMDAVCPNCAKKFAEGIPLTSLDRVRLVELPLNTTIDDVVGGLDERALVNERMRIKRGLLAQADKNLLYVDEINLLSNEITDAILDAAAQGNFTVRRGVLAATYRSRFCLIGSMNPEEGDLRPQIMDRFGLRVIVKGLNKPSERQEAYQRVRSYINNPRQVVAQYATETDYARSEIAQARLLLPRVEIPDKVAQTGIAIIQALQIDSLRSDINLFESARAYSAIDGRTEVTLDDLKLVTPMALRLRRSKFMTDYLTLQEVEQEELLKAFENSSAKFKRS